MYFPGPRLKRLTKLLPLMEQSDIFFSLCVTVNEIIFVNIVNKLNFLTNEKLINERKKLRIELKVQLLVKNKQLLNEPFRYVNLIKR